jgi:putative membrane protein
MAAPTQTGERPEVGDYLAAERTLLAWIRTGLALMGFGFVVARFGLFLQQLQILQHGPAVRSFGLSLWFGTALIGAGVLVNALSGWRHVKLVRIFNRQQGHQPYSTALAVFTSVFLALAGLAMAIYLITVRGSANL